jgi:hypothetical protein
VAIGVGIRDGIAVCAGVTLRVRSPRSCVRTTWLGVKLAPLAAEFLGRAGQRATWTLVCVPQADGTEFGFQEIMG